MRALFVLLMLFCTSCSAMKDWVVSGAEAYVRTELQPSLERTVSGELEKRAPVLKAAIDKNADGIVRLEELKAVDWTNPEILAAIGASLIALLKGFATAKEQAKSEQIVHARIDKTKGEVDELWDRSVAKSST